jgi:hypothetical protein
VPSKEGTYAFPIEDWEGKSYFFSSHIISKKKRGFAHRNNRHPLKNGLCPFLFLGIRPLLFLEAGGKNVLTKINSERI